MFRWAQPRPALRQKADIFFHPVEVEWDIFPLAGAESAASQRFEAIKKALNLPRCTVLMAVRVRPKGKIGEPVLAGWKNKLARLSQMNWDEIRTRAEQEIHKRSDLIRYRVGMPPSVPWIAFVRPAHPEFFFPTGGAQE